MRNHLGGLRKIYNYDTVSWEVKQSCFKRIALLRLSTGLAPFAMTLSASNPQPRNTSI